MKDSKARDTKREGARPAVYEFSTTFARTGDSTFEVTVAVTLGGETHGGWIAYVGVRSPREVAVQAIKHFAMFFTRSVATEENGLDPDGIIDFESIEVTGVAERLDGDTTRLIDPSEYDRRWSPSKTPS